MAEKVKLYLWSRGKRTLKLYDYTLSASCYKIRLMASLLKMNLNLEPVNFHPKREHKSKTFLEMNPAGTLPILIDGNKILTDTKDILIYLAESNGKNWLAIKNYEVVDLWLNKAYELNASLGMARLHDVLSFKVDVQKMRRIGTTLLRELEFHLSEQRFSNKSFIAGKNPSIADIACFPNVALAPDGGVSISQYPSIRLWCRAIRHLPGFIEMPGIFRAHELSK